MLHVVDTVDMLAVTPPELLALASLKHFCTTFSKSCFRYLISPYYTLLVLARPSTEFYPIDQ